MTKPTNLDAIDSLLDIIKLNDKEIEQIYKQIKDTDLKMLTKEIK